jgi:hypothetical protein
VADFSIGDEIWLLRYDRDRNDYVPELEGTVEGVGLNAYRVADGWIGKGTFPMFKTEQECREWIRENPFAAPEIK